MPLLTSPHWYENEGSCVKHGIPQVPCPACLAEQDPDIEVRLTEADRNFIEMENVLGDGCTVADILPADHADWLITRVVY